nr:Na+/H+ antiporter subunit E [Corynebacterium sp. TAE3-ERU12]
MVGQVIAAATEVILDNFRANPKQQPVLLSVPLRITDDVNIVLLTGSITMTPGTLVCGIRELPEGRRQLLVHCIFGADVAALRSDFYEMEQRLVPALRDEPWPEVTVIEDYDADRYPDSAAVTGTQYETSSSRDTVESADSAGDEGTK